MNLNCTNCKSDRLMRISGKTSDLFHAHYKGKDYNGYVPNGIVIGDDGYGDYIQLTYCLECGKIQGKFPVSEKKATEFFKDSAEIEQLLTSIKFSIILKA